MGLAPTVERGCTKDMGENREIKKKRSKVGKRDVGGGLGVGRKCHFQGECKVLWPALFMLEPHYGLGRL